MAISNAVATKLNKSNRAAQDAQLGTVIQGLQTGTGSDLVPAVAGVSEASHLALLGANKNLDVLAVADLKLGAGAGTSVTSTAAEINVLHNISPTLTYSELNLLDGVTKTTGEINLLMTGYEGGYKLARGTATIDAASKDVVTGLTTVVAVVVSMTGDPSMTHYMSSATVGDQAGAPAAGSIRIKSWKPTAANDVNPIPATSPFGNVSWVAIGV